MDARRRLTLALVFVLVGSAVSGCRPAPAPTTGPETAATPTQAPELLQSTDVRVYLVRGEYVGVAGRHLPHTDDHVEVARYAVEELLAGPTGPEKAWGLSTTVPVGTQLNGVEIDEGVATVDLSREFESGGGSLSMLLRVAQVVCTLTQFNEVETVAFKLDGEPTEAIGGEGIIVDPPVDRADFEGQLPPILVETPAPGDRISSAVDVSGSSNVFEATHQVQLTGPDGSVLSERTVTATSGTGTRGTWSTQITFDAPASEATGTIIAFALSPKDGSQTNVIEIPVRLME